MFEYKASKGTAQENAAKRPRESSPDEDAYTTDIVCHGRVVLDEFCNMVREIQQSREHRV
jgi:hypothetical protein